MSMLYNIYTNVHTHKDTHAQVNPEALVRVPMLYVRCDLHGVSLKALVDTGAQMTVMPSSFMHRHQWIHVPTYLPVYPPVHI